MTGERDPLDQEAQEVAAAENSANAQYLRNLELDDLRQVMNSKQGRRFMWRLLGKCGAMRQSFNTNGSIMSFNEGQRSIGIPLIADLMQHAPEKYAEMLKEHRKNDN